MGKNSWGQGDTQYSKRRSKMDKHDYIYFSLTERIHTRLHHVPLSDLVVAFGMQKNVSRWRMNVVVTLIPLLPPSWIAPQGGRREVCLPHHHNNNGHEEQHYHHPVCWGQKRWKSIEIIVLLSIILKIMIPTNTSTVPPSLDTHARCETSWWR